MAGVCVVISDRVVREGLAEEVTSQLRTERKDQGVFPAQGYSLMIEYDAGHGFEKSQECKAISIERSVVCVCVVVQVYKLENTFQTNARASSW